MKLITKESESRSRIDELVQIQHSVGSDSFLVYFYVSKEIAGETLEKALDNGLPLMIPVESISEALDIIYQKALELRVSQLDSLGKDSFVKLFTLQTEQCRQNLVLLVALFTNRKLEIS